MNSLHFNHDEHIYTLKTKMTYIDPNAQCLL